MLIAQVALRDRVSAALARPRVVVLVGPRQTGKTTLARTLLPIEHPNYIDLEHPEAETPLTQPVMALRDRTGQPVIDEVQRTPDLYKSLCVLADASAPRRPLPAARQRVDGAAAAVERIACRAHRGDQDRGFHARRGAHPMHRSSLVVRCGYRRSQPAAEKISTRAWRRQLSAAFTLRASYPTSSRRTRRRSQCAACGSRAAR
jgi:energy-coupling factor transporter ATP-binding protein EcfA2